MNWEKLCPINEHEKTRPLVDNANIYCQQQATQTALSWPGRNEICPSTSDEQGEYVIMITSPSTSIAAALIQPPKRATGFLSSMLRKWGEPSFL